MIVSNRQSGQTVVEVLVAIALSMIILPALATGLVAGGEGRAQEEQRIQAHSLQREAEEAIRSIRESSWSNISTNGTYHPVVSGSSWVLAANSETINELTREIVIEDVQRNSSGTIVESGGTIDPSTKKITVSVGWTTPIASNLSNTLYMTRYLNNTVWTQTTQAEFNTGTLSNTVTTANGDGEVELSGGTGGSKWSVPSVVGSYNTAQAQQPYTIKVVGNTAYIIDGNTLQAINITTPSSPSLLGSYTGSGTFTDLAISGNYAYITSTNNGSEFLIVNISNPATMSLTASVNLPRNTNGSAIAVDSTYAYVGRRSSRRPELTIFNITNPASPAQTGTLNLSGSINSMYLSGDTLYMATNINNQELLRVNVTNRTSPVVSGSYNTPSGKNASFVTMSGSNIYLGRGSGSGSEFYIFNTSLALLGSYDIGSNVTAIAIDGNYALLTTNDAAQEFKVLDISNPAAITLYSGLNLSGGGLDVVVVDDYAYATVNYSGMELTVIYSGGGGGYETSGTYESASFDAGAQVGFNNFAFSADVPVNTGIQLQIATNNDNATWNYVGPDGTAGTFYTSQNAIHYSNVLGRYFRYKAFFTSDGSATPSLENITLNYSP